MVGQMCSVCRRKQTTARNEAGEVCCVGCGGLDGRGRPRGSAAACPEEIESSASGSDDDAPDAPCAKTRGTIDFAGTKFTEHAELLPGSFRERVGRWLQVLGVTNRRLFESFMYFVVQYCAAQPVSSQRLCVGSLCKRWREHRQCIVPWWSKVAEEVSCRC